MEPNPFVVSEWDLKFTHIRIYTYISSDQLKSNSVNRKRERGGREREREREREGEGGRETEKEWETHAATNIYTKCSCNKDKV